MLETGIMILLDQRYPDESGMIKGGFFMLKDEEQEWDTEWEHWLHENPLDIGKGIVWGVLLGTLLWACIIGAAWYFFFR